MTTIRILCVAAACLVAALWWRWDTAPLRWTPPAAIVPDASIFQVQKAQANKPQAGVSSYLAVLDRPVFSSDRRPPAAIDEKPQIAEVDIFSNLQLLGLLTGQEFTGIIVRDNGKVRRIKVTDNVGGWQLQSVLDRDATFTRDGETKVLKLVPVKLATGGQNTAQANPAALTAPQPGAAPNSAEDIVALENQKREEAKRENIRKRNVLRASAGLPPIFD